MSVLGALALGKEVGDTIASPITAIGNILDNLFTSDSERLTHEEIKLRLLQAPDLAQIELNKIEAQHRSVFVAGWRPFIGWVGGVALAYTFILRDMICWVVVVTMENPVYPPDIDVLALLTIVTSLLGLGSLRTVEKIRGRSK